MKRLKFSKGGNEMRKFAMLKFALCTAMRGYNISGPDKSSLSLR